MLKIANDNGIYRVELFQVNKLNMLFSDLVKKQLMELVEENNCRVVFNLDGITFIDSSGFQTLIEVTRKAKQHGSELVLCNVSDEVRELILLMEIEGKLAFCECENTTEKILLVLD